MPSNEFQNEVGIFLQTYFPVSHRIHDCAFNRDMGRSVTQKPFDFFGADALGKLFGAEVKRVKSTSIPFSNFSKHQIDALVELGNNGWVFINWRIPKYGEGRSKRAGTAVWVTIEFFLSLYNSLDKKSLSPKDFPEEYFLMRETGRWTTMNHPLLRSSMMI